MKNFLVSILLVFFTISILLSGCGMNQHDREIKQIDSLLVELSSLEGVLNQVDSSKVNERSRTLIKNINFIQQNVDTMTKEIAFIIDKYARYKKAYVRWGEKMPTFYDETNLRKNQLNDLKTDLEKGLIEQEKVSIYLSGEVLHFKVLRDVIIEMEGNLKSIEQPHNEVELEINALIQEIKEKSGK